MVGYGYTNTNPPPSRPDLRIKRCMLLVSITNPNWTNHYLGPRVSQVGARMFQHLEWEPSIWEVEHNQTENIELMYHIEIIKVLAASRQVALRTP